MKHSRTELLNYLIQTRQLSDYLEIGVYDFHNFHQIQVQSKQWVDPHPKGYYVSYIIPSLTVEQKDGYCLTSDDFFLSKYPTKYDLIFIDGLHEAEQVKRDIQNSTRVLKPNGVIVCHDCNPMDVEMATHTPTSPVWYGTVWKGYCEFMIENSADFYHYTVDIDCGCGIIIPRKEHIETPPITDELNLSWEEFVERRVELLNLISWETFLSIKSL